MRLLTTAVTKTTKGRKWGYHTGVLYLHPDARNCQWWSEGCRKSCLVTAGRAGILKPGHKTNTILEARRRRTRYLREDYDGFILDLHHDVQLLQRQAEHDGLDTAVRLNGTSDLDWRRVVEYWPSVQFYDYTKSFDRMCDWLAGRMPDNYHLTFSRTEDNDHDCRRILDWDGNVAVVTMTGGWDGDNMLDSHGHQVNGDQHDLTFLHPHKSILVLKAKGKARKDTTGFTLPC